MLREHQPRAHSQDETLIRSPQRRPLAPPTIGRLIRALVDRADVEIASPSHAFRRTVATVMYEQGVRARVIERIMGWAPRQMHERHYLRVANEQMHDAILTLYRDDPISDRQAAALQLRPLTAPAKNTGSGLEREQARLDELEARLGLTAG